MAEPSIPIEAELTLFRPKQSIRRRAAERYRCGLATAGKLYFPASSTTQNAWVYNLSVSGIGLNLPEPLEAGCDVVIQLRMTGKIEVIRLPARVVHSTPEVDQTWRVGCEFVEPLAVETLDALLE